MIGDGGCGHRRRIVRNASHFGLDEQQEATALVRNGDDALLMEPLLVDGVGQIANELRMAAGQSVFAEFAETQRPIRAKVEHEQCFRVQLRHVPEHLLGVGGCGIGRCGDCAYAGGWVLRDRVRNHGGH